MNYISQEFYQGLVEPERILIKSKYKTSQTFSTITANELKDGKSLTLGDLVMNCMINM